MGLYIWHFRSNNQLERYIPRQPLHFDLPESDIYFFSFPYLEILNKTTNAAARNAMFCLTREETLTRAFKNKIAFTNLKSVGSWQ